MSDNNKDTELGNIGFDNESVPIAEGRTGSSPCIKDCWKKMFVEPFAGWKFDIEKEVTITPSTSWQTLQSFTAPSGCTTIINAIGQLESAEDYSTLKFRLMLNDKPLDRHEDGISEVNGHPYGSIYPASESYNPMLLLNSDEKFEVQIQGASEDTERTILSRISGKVYRIKCC